MQMSYVPSNTVLNWSIIKNRYVIYDRNVFKKLSNHTLYSIVLCVVLKPLFIENFFALHKHVV